MTRTPEHSTTHLVLIPSYNTGTALLETTKEALQFWSPVWVIVDGSTDESGAELQRLAPSFPGLKVMSLPQNGGKGAAVLAGMRAAKAAGFHYVLVMDADGQHPADKIPACMRLSAANPSGMVLGTPEFGAEAPFSRKYGRQVGNFWTNLETLWGGIGDSLFGFRVYPIRESLAVLEGSAFGKRYDFDTFLVVKLYWRGVRPFAVKVPVRYFAPGQGGVSHFHYVKDNLLLIKLHLYLLATMLPRVPDLIRRRKKGCEDSTPAVSGQHRLL